MQRPTPKLRIALRLRSRHMSSVDGKLAVALQAIADWNVGFKREIDKHARLVVHTEKHDTHVLYLPPNEMNWRHGHVLWHQRSRIGGVPWRVGAQVASICGAWMNVIENLNPTLTLRGE